MAAQRDPKFTPALAAKFVEIVRRGNFRETACAEVGIDPSTMRKWLRAAANGDKRYANWVLELDRAEAEAEDIMVVAIRKAAIQDWRAAAWYLERRGPKRWGFKAQVEVSVTEELERILNVVERELGREASDRVYAALVDVDVGEGAAEGAAGATDGQGPGGGPVH